MKLVSLLFVLLFAGTLFSQQTVGVFQYENSSQSGYTLLAPSASKQTYLIDNCGREINQWTSLHNPGAVAYLEPNGHLLRTARIGGAFSGGGIGGRVEEFDWDGNLVWGYDFADANTHQHHDIERLPNGNIIVLLWERHSEEEGLLLGRDPSISYELWCPLLLEVERIGSNEINIVWRWSLWDHLVQELDPDLPGYGVVAENPQRFNINFNHTAEFFENSADWLHCNSVDYNPDLDQIILNSRNTNEFYILDHSTTIQEAASSEGGTWGKGGDFLYRFGNPQVYDRGLPEDRVLFQQHDAHWIESGLPNAGSVLVFNNVASSTGSRIERYTLPQSAPGVYILNDNEPYGPETWDWSFEEDGFFSLRISGCQRMPNGNTLVCEGSSGTLFEVNDFGETVWRYINPVNNLGPVSQGTFVSQNSVFRAYRYMDDFQGFVGKDLSPQDYLEGDWGFECPSNSIEEDMQTELLIRSLGNGAFTIEMPQDSGSYTAEVFGLTGQLLREFDFTSSSYFLNLSRFASQVVILKMTTPQGNIIRKLKI